MRMFTKSGKVGFFQSRSEKKFMIPIFKNKRKNLEVKKSWEIFFRESVDTVRLPRKKREDWVKG